MNSKDLPTSGLNSTHIDTMTRLRKSPTNSRDAKGVSLRTRLLIGMLVLASFFYFGVFQPVQQDTIYRYADGISLGSSWSDAYNPSNLENYVLENSESLGFNVGTEENPADACPMWRNANGSLIYNHLQAYRAELDEYSRLLEMFPGASVEDVRLHLHEGICDTLEVTFL
jgi:hypothetical protein